MYIQDFDTIERAEYLLRIYNLSLDAKDKFSEKKMRHYRRKILNNPICDELITVGCSLLAERKLINSEDLLRTHINLLNCRNLPFVAIEFTKFVVQDFGIDCTLGVKAYSLLAKTYIELKKNDLALEAINIIEKSNNVLWDESVYGCLSWKYWKISDINKSRQYFYKSGSNYLDTLVKLSPNLKQLNANHPKINKVIIFLTTYNEIELIEVFLNYYRNIGSVHFVIIDNNSADGTADFLVGQSDVLLYTTKDSFSDSKFGSVWVNKLAEQLTSSSSLCIRVDADEFLVWNNMHNESLNDFLDNLNQSNIDIVSGPLIDMVPANFQEQNKILKETGMQNIFSTSSYFDPCIINKGSIYPPYIFYRGGIRERLLEKSITYLTKTPIFRGGGLIKYLNANHRTTPGKVKDLVAILHYKFTPNSINRFEEQIKRGEHGGGGGRHRKLRDLIRKGGDLPLSNSHKYINADSLVKCGILKPLAS